MQMKLPLFKWSRDHQVNASLLSLIGLFNHSFTIPLLTVMHQGLLWRTEWTLWKSSGKRVWIFIFILLLSQFCSFLIVHYCSLVDISPPAQGVDHRHVQKELGEVIVRLHNPVVMSPTTIQVTWTVSVARHFDHRIQLYFTVLHFQQVLYIVLSVYTRRTCSQDIKSVGFVCGFLISLHSFTSSES